MAPYTTPLTIEEGTTAKDANGNLYTGTLTAKGGTYTFVLSNDEQMVLSVPYGYKVTVTEQQGETTAIPVSSQYYETGSAGKVLTPGAATQTVDSIDKDYTVEFANNRNPVAPTGLESNHTAPYTLMITGGRHRRAGADRQHDGSSCAPPPRGVTPMRTMQDIADQLSAMKFRKKTFGGVDEADVWKKLEALQEIYQQVYDDQAAYYQALLDERDKALARMMGRRGDAHE